MTLTVKSVVHVGEDKYSLQLVNQHGSVAKTPKSYTLDDIEKIVV